MDSFGKLRGIAAEEIELMRNWRNAPSVRANMYTRHEISAAEHAAWWETTVQRDDLRYFMYELAGCPAGIVGFTGINKASRNSSWAFYVAPDVPRGTGSKMEFLALDCAFTRLGLHKLFCEVLAFNTPVIKMHQKFGFQIEGVFREHCLVDEKYVDVYRLGILCSEWQALRESMQERIEAISKVKA